MATQEEYLAAIQREIDANARAQAEGYESAAHKEAHANVGAQKAGYSDAAAYERDANIRAQKAGWSDAAAYERDANIRSQKAGFTSAVDQEIDANRRARDAGWLNAADLELYGPEGATRSKAKFVDPRDLPPEPIPPQFAIGSANDIEWNPDQPNHPDYDPNWRNDPKWIEIYGDGGETDTKGEAGSMDLLSYRPGSQKYWDTYLPKNTGLMDMNIPPPEYSLAYAPGEFLYPNTYKGVMDAPGDQMRNLPGGKWRYGTVGAEGYNASGAPKQGYGGALNTPGWGTTANPMPWQFTSPAMRTNIAQQPWNAKQLNISPTQGEAWQGLLTDLGTAPAIDTTSLSLLGVA